MIYDEDFLINFSGNIEVLDVSLSELTNSLERYVSQKEYEFSVSHPFSDENTYIKIRFLNSHIPHLIGLSRGHHVGLPTYHSEVIFENLKSSEDWTLKRLKSGDEGWFNECRDKIIGCFYLYQMLNNLDTKSFSTKPFKGPKDHRLLKRIERDNVSYIMIKTIEGISYSLEFASTLNEPEIFFPRSLKINDPIAGHLVPISLSAINVERVKQQKQKKKKKKRKKLK